MEGAGPLVAAPTYRGQPASWDPVSEPILGLRVCGYHTQWGTCQNPPSKVSTAVLVWVTVTPGVALQRVREGEHGRAARGGRLGTLTQSGTCLAALCVLLRSPCSLRSLNAHLIRWVFLSPLMSPGRRRRP